MRVRLFIGEMTSEPERNAYDAQVVDAIAERVVELLAAARPAPTYLGTAGDAAMLDVSDEWVRDHAAEIGAIRLGDGPRGQLRFDVNRVRDALERRRLRTEPRRRPRRPAPRRVDSVTLLPLPGAAR